MIFEPLRTLCDVLGWNRLMRGEIRELMEKIKFC